MENEF
jgi:hypothetical protein